MRTFFGEEGAKSMIFHPSTPCKFEKKKVEKVKNSQTVPPRWAAMDPETIQAAKRIVNKRGKGDKDGVEGRLAALECKLDGVQAALQDLTKMLSKSKLMK